jgi:hypothetical protein
MSRLWMSGLGYLNSCIILIVLPALAMGFQSEFDLSLFNTSSSSSATVCDRTSAHLRYEPSKNETAQRRLPNTVNQRYKR